MSYPGSSTRHTSIKFETDGGSSNLRGRTGHLPIHQPAVKLPPLTPVFEVAKVTAVLHWVNLPTHC